jgi:hypothetical protein
LLKSFASSRNFLSLAFEIDLSIIHALLLGY